MNDSEWLLAGEVLPPAIWDHFFERVRVRVAGTCRVVSLPEEHAAILGRFSEPVAFEDAMRFTDERHLRRWERDGVLRRISPAA